MLLSNRKSFIFLYLCLFAAVALTGSVAQNLTAQGPADTSQNTSNNATNKDVEETSPNPSQPSPAHADRQSDPSLQLGVGDLIELTVYDVPELTTKTRISSTGDIYCALIGPTHVAGLTIEEASSLIEKRLSAFLKDPYVSLFVTE